MAEDHDISTADRTLPAQVYVADTGTARGRGVFAAQSFRAGDLIESSPVLVLYLPFDALPPRIQRIAFNWGGLTGGQRSAAVAYGYGSLYNHNNPSNLRFEAESGKEVINYYAVRDIAIDQELTINYNSSSGDSISQRDDWFELNGIVPIIKA